MADVIQDLSKAVTVDSCIHDQDTMSAKVTIKVDNSELG